MSKVYEALKQSEDERRGLLPGDQAGSVSERTESGDPLDPELGVTDELLRAAFSSAGVEEQFGGRLAERSDSSSTEPAIAYRVSPQDFRRISLSCQEDCRLTMLADPHGLPAEQFRFLKKSLEHKFPRGGVLLITSPAPQDGKTLMAMNLASYLAESGCPTLLVEGDIRQPSFHKVLGVSNDGAGVEEAMAGMIDLREAVQFVEQLSSYVAMVKTPPEDPSRVIGGNDTKRVLSWARDNFHWVIVDSPPVLATADVDQLSTLVDGVFLVVRAQSTPRDLVKRAFEVLAERLSGVILNDAPIESSPYYRYRAAHRKNRLKSGRA